MATTSVNTSLLSNTQHNLSNLSKGVGEFTNGYGKVEVVLDDQVLLIIKLKQVENLSNFFFIRTSLRKKLKLLLVNRKKMISYHL